MFWRKKKQPVVAGMIADPCPLTGIEKHWIEEDQERAVHEAQRAAKREAELKYEIEAIELQIAPQLVVLAQLRAQLNPQADFMRMLANMGGQTNAHGNLGQHSFCGTLGTPVGVHFDRILGVPFFDN